MGTPAGRRARVFGVSRRKHAGGRVLSAADGLPHRGNHSDKGSVECFHVVSLPDSKSLLAILPVTYGSHFICHREIVLHRKYPKPDVLVESLEWQELSAILDAFDTLDTPLRRLRQRF